MCAFRKMFGQKKPDCKNQDEALKQLRTTLDLINKKSEFLEKKIAEELANARKYGLKQKNLALKALVRKKRYEEQMRKLDNTAIVIEEQIHNLENAGMNLEVFSVLKTSSAAVKAAHKNMKIDDVHDLMDDLAEQRALADEISEAISNPGALGAIYDEDELLAELESLQAEQLQDQLLDVGSVSDLPNVPTKEIPKPTTSKAVEDDAEKDLKELLAWTE